MKTTILILLASSAVALAQNLRVVDGKIYNSTNFQEIGAGDVVKVVEDTPDGTICELLYVKVTYNGTYFGNRELAHSQYIIVKNYPNPGDLLTDHVLSPRPRAIQTGKMQTGYGTLPVFDCGTLWTPPPPPPATPEQIAAAKAKAEAARKAGEEKALKMNQDLAAKGDAYGLLRMGERYRDGAGVEKDLLKAREYFTNAIAAGSLDASNELATLPAK